MGYVEGSELAGEGDSGRRGPSCLLGRDNWVVLLLCWLEGYEDEQKMEELPGGLEQASKAVL